MVLQPARNYLIGIGVVMGVPMAAGLGGGLLLLTHGQLGGGIALLLLAALLVYVLIRLRRISLIVDESRIVKTDLWGTSACRKDELAGIQLRRGWRSSRFYAFITRDGSEAFRTDADAWRSSDIAALTQKLGVPLQQDHAASMPRYTCPVCGYAGLNEAPVRDGAPSHEICPSCGFEFGVTDADGTTYRSWRERWVQAGMPWWAKQAGQDPPQGWDPAAQIKSLG